MLGAIAGDIIGSVYEHRRSWEEQKHPRFDPLFARKARVSCQVSVPQAILAFLESNDFEHVVRLAVSLGGDDDTLACIAGGIAQAYYRGVPGPIREQALSRLDDRLRGVVEEFEARFG